MGRRIATLLIGVFVALTPTDGARARTQESLRYRFEHIWNAAVRLVRVDMGLTIRERDPEAGFFLFEYVDHDKAYPGSFELVRTGSDGRDAVQAVIHVGGMPRYVERMILTKLEKKLGDEYGEPAPPAPPAAPPPPAPPSQEEPAPDEPS